MSDSGSRSRAAAMSAWHYEQARDSIPDHGHRGEIAMLERSLVENTAMSPQSRVVTNDRILWLRSKIPMDLTGTYYDQRQRGAGNSEHKDEEQ